MSDLDFPEHWSPAARDLVENVLDARPDLDGREFEALVQAATLTTTADALDDVARAAGYMTTGSQGQPVAHPATVESRLARTAVAQIMARLTPTQTTGALTATERARSAARARWSAARAAR